MRPVQLPCSLGRFWDKAERVRHRGRGWILSLTPCLLQLPRPAAPPTAPLGPARGNRGHWETPRITSPAPKRHNTRRFAPHSGPYTHATAPPQTPSGFGVQLVQHLLVQNTLFWGTLYCPIQAELFWGFSALPWAEPRITGPAGGLGGSHRPRSSRPYLGSSDGL